MRQGSSVTYTVQPESRQRSSSRAACLRAEKLRMPCRVMVDLAPIMRLGDDLALIRDNCPDGHLAKSLGLERPARWPGA